MHSNQFIPALLAILSLSKAIEIDDQAEKDKEEEIASLFEDDEASEGRGFFNFDRGNAFNTSVAFTIPLFSFTLPGAQDSIDAGLDDGNTFGLLAFVTLFLVTALGVAIYTTSQGGNANARSFNGNSRYFETEEGNTLTNRVLTAIEEIPKVLDFQSCYHLSVCQAYENPTSYGYIGNLMRWLSDYSGTNGTNEKPASKAALYGENGSDECYYEYPCLVQPLDSFNFVKNTVTRNIMSFLH